MPEDPVIEDVSDSADVVQLVDLLTSILSV